MYGLMVVALFAFTVLWFIRQFNDTNKQKWFRRLRPTGYLLGALARNAVADARAAAHDLRTWPMRRRLRKELR